MNKTAIISGANGALGSVIVRKFLEMGFFVNAFYHSTIRESDNETFKGFSVNLLEEDETKKAVDEIIRERSTIETLVCTAGGFQMGNIEKTETADLQKQYRLNFLTAYHIVQPVYLQMKKQGFGRIFLIGSRQGLDTHHSVNTIAYGLAKSLLFHLADILNEDSKGKVVTSVVVPSTIDTKANRDSMPGADFSKWISPEEIADIIAFYNSRSANAIRNPVIQVFGES